MVQIMAIVRHHARQTTQETNCSRSTENEDNDVFDGANKSKKVSVKIDDNVPAAPTVVATKKEGIL